MLRRGKWQAPCHERSPPRMKRFAAGRRLEGSEDPAAGQIVRNASTVVVWYLCYNTLPAQHLGPLIR